MKVLRSSTVVAGLSLSLVSSPVQALDADPNDLLNMSLEQLSNIEITSVSKRSEKASEAAAAVYVVTQDDIRRSGATTIPEVLRIVPGLNVAQSGSHQWSISTRGFNDQFANKLLVLIDGRSVYTPLFSGVYWDAQDTMMQDIERIEVIRGPGATLWGANAVNGVINIITKSAKSTQGGIASFTAGNQEVGLSSARYGAKIAEDAYFRAYAKYDNHDSFRTLRDRNANDPWNKAQAGFRTDWKDSSSNSFTFQGDVYRAGESGILNLPAVSTPTFNREYDRGGNILGRMDHRLSKDSNVTLQMYYDDVRRSNIVLNNRLQTFDADLQHVWSVLQGQEIVWGGGYRFTRNTAEDTDFLKFTPDNRSDGLFSAFLQDKITLIPSKMFLTLGSKFEKNDYTDFEFQPSARVSYVADNKQTFWGSVSRAVRTPNIATADSQLIVSPFSTGPLVVIARDGNDNAESEELTAYELGYRNQITKDISVDAAAYYNDYDNLILGALGSSSGPFNSGSLGTYFVQSVIPVNTGSAESWGGELSAKWSATSYLDLAAAYSFQQLNFDQPDPYGFSFAGKSPKHQFNVRSALFLPHDVEVNNAVYFVDNLKSGSVPSYARVDMRVAWKPFDSVELSLVGQNLFDDAHQEFSGFLFQNASQVPRSVYGNVTWKF